MASKFDDFEVFTSNLVQNQSVEGRTSVEEDAGFPIVDPSEVENFLKNEEPKKEDLPDASEEKDDEVAEDTKKENGQSDIKDIDPDQLKEETKDPSSLGDAETVEGTKSLDSADEEEGTVTVSEPDGKTDEPVLSDLSEFEAEIAPYVQEKLYEALGWTFEEGDEKIENIEGIVQYMEELVEKNSAPRFASQDVADMNKYVEDGGNLSNYFNTRYSNGVDLNTLDVDNSSDQKLIIREYFGSQGYSGDKVEKRIERYEDGGVLVDEAADALEWLKNTKEKESQKLLEDQENLRKQTEKSNKELYDNVTSYIRGLNNVLGVPINRQEKEELIKSIFTVESDGATKFQKEYAKSVENLVKSAVVVLMEDKLKERTNKKVSSDTAEKLKKKLRAARSNDKLEGASGAGNMSGSGDRYSAVNNLASFLTKP